ncbi:hypothetical protein ACQPZZ_29390 [Microbispora sp. CA-135349]|uniref:hypothetical protein n=1 Tax=Microbispora sp. CA-135349 TaxID=3239953 RepID=UPI003D8F9E5D
MILERNNGHFDAADNDDVVCFHDLLYGSLPSPTPQESRDMLDVTVSADDSEPSMLPRPGLEQALAGDPRHGPPHGPPDDPASGAAPGRAMDPAIDHVIDPERDVASDAGDHAEPGDRGGAA